MLANEWLQYNCEMNSIWFLKWMENGMYSKTCQQRNRIRIFLSAFDTKKFHHSQDSRHFQVPFLIDFTVLYIVVVIYRMLSHTMSPIIWTFSSPKYWIFHRIQYIHAMTCSVFLRLILLWAHIFYICFHSLFRINYKAKWFAGFLMALAKWINQCYNCSSPVHCSISLSNHNARLSKYKWRKSSFCFRNLMWPWSVRQMLSMKHKFTSWIITCTEHTPRAHTHTFMLTHSYITHARCTFLRWPDNLYRNGLSFVLIL